ncbi:hypothetical protein ACLEPN_41620, partial [Myxococcus sp. 1LA]
SAHAVVDRLLGVVFRGALEHAAREGRRLRLESVDCRAVLSVVDAFVDVRGELTACEAARDAALLQASEAAEGAHDACREREEAECDRDQARADLEHAGQVNAELAAEVADLKGQLRRATESAEYEAERARRAELDRDAEVSTLRDDRQRLAWRWGRERTERQQWQGGARLLSGRLGALRVRNRLLLHRLKEAAVVRRAALEALAALEDRDTAWTPAGEDVRRELRRALGVTP